MSQVIPSRVRRGLGAAAVAVSVSVVGLWAALPAHALAGVALAPPPVREEDRVEGGDHLTATDHLTVTLLDAGDRRDGTFEVYCHPEGGSHPDVAGACLALDRRTRWGTDVFAPAASGGMCTMQYGGPATAHVTGRWAGRPVDTTYDRRDGCAIERWDALVPLLPKLG
ncbi:SSI family serine proteinase inhibitor [Streptomyces sp. NPDC002920]